MKVITWETLYYEDHGATLKHKCGKRIVTLSLLSFFLSFFWAFSFLWPFSFFLLFLGLIFFYGLSLFFSFFIFLTWDNALENDGHHTFIYLQLNDYNSILEQRWLYINASGGVSGYAMMHEWHVWRIMNGGIATNMMSTTWSCKQYDNDEACHNNGTVESCMEIYLGMAMEVP